MLDTAANFGELTEQAVRELLVIVRVALWSDTQACTLALIVVDGTMTARATATLEEAVPGLRRHLTRQKIHVPLAGRTVAVACIVRSCVEEAGRNAEGAVAQRQWNRWEHELQPRYPAVEVCAGANSKGRAPRAWRSFQLQPS